MTLHAYNTVCKTQTSLGRYKTLTGALRAGKKINDRNTIIKCYIAEDRKK